MVCLVSNLEHDAQPVLAVISNTIARLPALRLAACMPPRYCLAHVVASYMQVLNCKRHGPDVFQFGPGNTLGPATLQSLALVALVALDARACIQLAFPALEQRITESLALCGLLGHARLQVLLLHLPWQPCKHTGSSLWWH